MARTVTAAEDWLSFALAEYDTDKIAASNQRAEAALKVRLEQRVSRFLKAATDVEELGMRLDVVDPTVSEIVNEVATEYGANPETLYESAVSAVGKIAAGDFFQQPFQQGGEGVPPHSFTDVPCQKCGHPAALGVPCKWCGNVNEPTDPSTPEGFNPGSLRQRIMGATVPDDAGHDSYEHDSVNPNNKIGDTPASSAFEGTKFDTDVEKALDGSKDHPRQFQNVADHVEDRRTLNDGKDKSVGVERAVGNEDLGAKNPFTEQHGKGGTFAEGDRGSAGAADAVTSKFHILD